MSQRKSEAMPKALKLLKGRIYAPTSIYEENCLHSSFFKDVKDEMNCIRNESDYNNIFGVIEHTWELLTVLRATSTNCCKVHPLPQPLFYSPKTQHNNIMNAHRENRNETDLSLKACG